jgi:hypothetical protein
MFFFQRLFALYYLMLIKIRRNRFLRHINRNAKEDFGAVCFVVLDQFYLIIFIIWTLSKIFGVEMPTIGKDGILYIKISVLIIMMIGLYTSSKYFLKNRERRNQFIDSFRDLTGSRRILWNIVGIFLMFAPVWFLIYLIWQRAN